MTKEVVFTDGGLTSGIRFSVDNNRTIWKVLPRGETGTSKAFNDPQQLEQFMRSRAWILDFHHRSRVPRLVIFLSSASRLLHSGSHFLLQKVNSRI